MSKLGKRLVSAFLAAVLILSMGISVFAAPSAESGGLIDVIEAKDKNGNDVNIKVIPVQPENKETADWLKDKDNLKDVLGDKYLDGMEVYDDCEIIVEGDSSLIEFPVTVKFKVPGVKEGTKVEVLVYVNGEWKRFPCTVGNGTVTVTFNSLDELVSIVSFIVDKNGMVPGSPDTGEGAMTTVIGMLVIFAAAGAVVLRRKIER